MSSIPKSFPEPGPANVIKFKIAVPEAGAVKVLVVCCHMPVDVGVEAAPPIFVPDNFNCSCPGGDTNESVHHRMVTCAPGGNALV